MSSTNDRGVDDGEPAVSGRSLLTQRSPAVSWAAEPWDRAQDPTGGGSVRTRDPSGMCRCCSGWVPHKAGSEPPDAHCGTGITLEYFAHGASDKLSSATCGL